MQKSSKIKLCLLTLPLALVAVAAVGCDGDDHTHTYSSEWAFNAEAHWHPAECSHDAKTNKSDHSFVTTVIPASVTSAGYTLHSCACGYSYTSDTVGSLPVEGDLRFDEEGHWKPVLSGEAIEKVAHQYKDTVVESTCTTFGYTKHVCECGYWYASDTTQPKAHTYDESVWGHDEHGHWHPALCCGAKSGTVAHNYTESVTPATCETKGYTEFTCTDCGYSYQGREVPAGHTYSDTLTGGEYEHWRPANCTHSDEKTDVEDHYLVGKSDTCLVCGTKVSPRLAYELSATKDYYIVTGLGCIDTMNISIPDTYREKPVQEIAARAFKDTEITAVTFGANVQKIGTEAFANAAISAVSLPSTVKEIGTKAFADTAISSLTLGESLEKVGNAAFRDCKLLTTVTIEGDVSALPPYAFAGCEQLATVSGSKLKEIGAQAFANCSELTTLDLSLCESVGFAAFGGCTKFAPAAMPKLAVTEEYAFSGCAIQTVTLPETLKEVADNLFNGCEKLTTATINSASISNSAFEGCVLLETLTLSGTQLIGANAFKGCEKLTALTLPATVIRVGASAFDGTGLMSEEDSVRYAANVAVGVVGTPTSVTLKTGTVGIADGVFKGLGLTEVTLGDSVSFIGVDAFRKCDKLTEITFGASVKYIGANSFRESGLTSVTVPATVLSVGDNAFYDCADLTSVAVSAQAIGKFAFSYTGVGRTLNSPVKSRPDYAKLTAITLGDGVKTIGSNAFQYCPVTSITLPESVTQIGMYAFAQTDLTGITVPANVALIGQYAFYQSKITTATFANATGWKAGKHTLSLNNATQNATYLKTTYVDYDWIKE